MFLDNGSFAAESLRGYDPAVIEMARRDWTHAPGDLRSAILTAMIERDRAEKANAKRLEEIAKVVVSAKPDEASGETEEELAEKCAEAKKRLSILAQRVVYRSINVDKASKLNERFKKSIERNSAPRLDEIMGRVAFVHSMTVDEVKSPHRARNLVAARQEYFYLARTLTNRSWPEIAQRCGGRDHTTAMHGAAKHAERNDLPPPEAGRRDYYSHLNREADA